MINSQNEKLIVTLDENYVLQLNVMLTFLLHSSIFDSAATGTKSMLRKKVQFGLGYYPNKLWKSNYKGALDVFYNKATRIKNR